MTFARATTLASVLLITFLTTEWVRSGYDVEMRPPEIPLSALPMQMGDWQGSAVDIDDETVRVVNAHSFANRLYTDSLGQTISLHAAAFIDPEFRGAAPHHPQVCYPAAGWEIVERKQVVIETAQGAVPLECILFQRESQQLVTAHWYESGPTRFSDAGGAPLARGWGRGSSPCIEKFLLQIDVPTIQTARPVLDRFIPLLVSSLSATD